MVATAAQAGTTSAPRGGLMDSAREVSHWLHHLLQAFVAGRAALPLYMGLDAALFNRLLASDPALASWQPAGPALAAMQLRAELLAMRQHEWQQIRDLLLGHAAPGAAPLAEILAAGALGFHHLWEDLGLACRPDLKRLMQDCFPSLERLNVQQMRWKKFFYRQLCQAGGEYVCRAPSCDECPERAACFE